MPHGTDVKLPRDAIKPARKRTDTLLPAAWILPKTAGNFLVTTCRIEAASHGRLVEWTQRKLKREGNDVAVILHGLHEMIAYFAPEASFVTVKRGNNGDPASLSVTFTGDRSSDLDLRARMRTALSKWLEITFTKEPVTDRLKISEIVMKDENWRMSGVSGECRWNKGLTCPEAVDRGLWDALAAHAVSALSGLKLRLRDEGADRWLIPTRPQAGGGTYNGIELMALPLKGSLEHGFFTEVVTVATATFPEREGVHLIMRLSMRNWGKLGERGTGGRVLDVFMPGLGAGNYGNWKHSSFEFKGIDYKPSEDKARDDRRWMWKHDTSRKVMGVLGSLTELSWIAEDVPVAPIDVPGEYSIMPRLGTVHGDKHLPGGSGIAWHHRHDIITALSPCLEAIGLQRAEPLQRLKRPNNSAQNIFKKASRPKDPKAPAPPKADAIANLERMEVARKKFEQQVAEHPSKIAKFERQHGERTLQRRGALRSALRQLDGVGADTLEMFVFTADDSSPARVATHLCEILGQPTGGSAEDMAWHDEDETLRIILRVSHPGSLSERMDWITLSDAESVGLTAEARKKREKGARQAYWKAVRHRMEGEVKVARNGRRAVACAILEMPAGLDAAPFRDPYTLAKNVLASHRILVQPMFVTGAVPQPGSKAENEQQAKYEMSAKDCLRMLGVVTTNERDIAPAAIHVVQKGKKLRGATTVTGQAVPLAARINKAGFEVALPDAGTGEPIWMAYGEAVLKVMSGDYTPLSRSRSEENQNRFLNFFAQALRDIAAHAPSLVLAEQGGTTQYLPTLQNGSLAWDVLRAGTTTFSPAMLPGVRIVRTTTSSKLPHYCQEIEPQSDGSPSQWSSGLFTWGGLEDKARRTAFSLKTKPVNAQKGARAMMVTRDGNPGSNQVTDDGAQRKSAPLEELCAVFIQPEDRTEPLRLVDLADRWRGLHVAYGGDTRLPFPLHELKLIEHAIVGELDD